MDNYLWIFPTEQYLQFLDDDRRSFVESFADMLEHDEAHGDADDGVKDDERLPTHGGRGAVTVPCGQMESDRSGQEQRHREGE